MMYVEKNSPNKLNLRKLLSSYAVLSFSLATLVHLATEAAQSSLVKISACCKVRKRI